MTKEFSADRLDIRAFTQQQGELEGAEALQHYPRLAQDQPADTAAQVRWHAQGFEEGDDARGKQSWLHLEAETVLRMTCQRCLQPADITVAVDRDFRFVADEDAALGQDDDSDEDILVFDKQFNLHELIEDELLMETPMVPMHDACPQAVVLESSTQGFETATEGKPNPFAALASLRIEKSGE